MTSTDTLADLLASDTNRIARARDLAERIEEHAAELARLVRQAASLADDAEGIARALGLELTRAGAGSATIDDAVHQVASRLAGVDLVSRALDPLGGWELVDLVVGRDQ